MLYLMPSRHDASLAKVKTIVISRMSLGPLKRHSVDILVDHTAVDRLCLSAKSDR